MEVQFTSREFYFLTNTTMMYYFNGYNEPFNMFGFGFGMIFMIVFWGLIIYGGILLIRYFSQTETTNKNNALEILKARYAAGKITHEEFENIKKDLL